MPTDETLNAKPNCGICKKVCTDPKFLPCQHSFCKICLKFNISKVPTNRQWEGFSCPYCKNYIKAIDPDQPLQAWADQFPNVFTPKKRRSRASISSIGSPKQEVPPPLSPNDKTSKPTSLSSVSSSLSSLVHDKTSKPTSLSSVSSSLSEEPVFAEPESPFKSVPEDSKEAEDDMVKRDEVDNLQEVFKDELLISDVQTNERKCLIHPWKPLIIICTACDSEACGQCLTENHPSCSAEAFKTIDDTPLFPDDSDLEPKLQELKTVHKNIQLSPRNIRQSRDQIMMKIRHMAQEMIKDMRNEEMKMVNKVKRLYRQEILRLHSGIQPCEELYKEVKQLRTDAEQLTNHHSTVVLERAEKMEEKQKTLLEKLRDVDLACVPPDVEFVKEYGFLEVSLGSLVVDSGSYPKHDIPEKAVQDVSVQGQTSENMGDDELHEDVNELPELHLKVNEVLAEPKTNTSEVRRVSKTLPLQTPQSPVSPNVQKTKSQTLIGRLLSHSPKGTQKQTKSKSKFFVKSSKTSN